jgi:hypothetical protein
MIMRAVRARVMFVLTFGLLLNHLIELS